MSKVDIDMTSESIEVAVAGYHELVRQWLPLMRKRAELSTAEIAARLNETLGGFYTQEQVANYEDGLEIPASTLLAYSRICGFVYLVGFASKEKWKGDWEILSAPTKEAKT